MLHKNTPAPVIELPPLALYVHIPWCIRKCPYCDFNSHAANGELPVEAYTKALISDLKNDIHFVQGRKLGSIFFGGGTPSLFPASAIEQILRLAENLIGFEQGIEISLEVNPGASEYSNFDQLYRAGVNRLSFGAQSFNNEHLQRLGRIHSANEIGQAVNNAVRAGFSNFNIDLMHGLTEQSPEQALDDLQQAMELQPSHLSWYQLTIEANTAYYQNPPTLPSDDVLADIQDAGHELLEQHGFSQYEVSAYAQEGKQSKHNLNYWRFGDYLAIGAGAHGKITIAAHNEIQRLNKTRAPQDYMAVDWSKPAKTTKITRDELALEFMMNALRLNEGVSIQLFETRTGLGRVSIDNALKTLATQGLLEGAEQHIKLTKLGRRFLNDALAAF